MKKKNQYFYFIISCLIQWVTYHFFVIVKLSSNFKYTFFIEVSAMHSQKIIIKNAITKILKMHFDALETWEINTKFDHRSTDSFSSFKNRCEILRNVMHDSLPNPSHQFSILRTLWLLILPIKCASCADL